MDCPVTSPPVTSKVTTLNEPVPTYSVFPSGETATELATPESTKYRRTNEPLAGSTATTVMPAATNRVPSGPAASTPSGAADSAPMESTVQEGP